MNAFVLVYMNICIHLSQGRAGSCAKCASRTGSQILGGPKNLCRPVIDLYMYDKN
jgi:hypothetical protein